MLWTSPEFLAKYFSESRYFNGIIEVTCANLIQPVAEGPARSPAAVDSAARVRVLVCLGELVWASKISGSGGTRAGGGGSTWGS